MARSVATNADGAANVLQAWDMAHGNVLLSGWTLSDVSFYTTELVQYALLTAAWGRNPDVVHVASASTYTLLIVCAALVAKGEARGRAAVLRVGLVVAALLVPQPHSGWAIVLNDPDHTGTAVPLLATWLLVDRRDRTPLRSWWPVGVLVLLALAQVGDPLALFVGALPLAAVGGWRLVRDRAWRGTDAQLFLAAVSSTALAQGILKLVWRLGGFSVHQPIAQFSPAAKLPGHLWMAVRAVALDYGAYLPFLHGWVDVAAGVVNLAMLLLAAVGLGVAGHRLLRRPRRAEGDRVASILAVAILLNLAAYVFSTQASTLSSARQVVTVLPFGAALAARVLADPLVRLARRMVAPAAVVAATAAVALLVAFATQATAVQPRPVEAKPVADWLQAEHLRYGLGSYWASNNVTVATGGKIHVAPAGGPGVRAYHWESAADWYDAALHDARFLIVDRQHPEGLTVSAAEAQLGAPVERHDFGRFVVLVYHRNLLIGLPPGS